MCTGVFTSVHKFRVLMKELRASQPSYTGTSSPWWNSSFIPCVHIKLQFVVFFSFAAASACGPFPMIYPEPCRVYLYSVDLQARLITTRSLINSFHRRRLAFPSATSTPASQRLGSLSVVLTGPGKMNSQATPQDAIVTVCKRSQKSPLLCCGKIKWMLATEVQQNVAPFNCSNICEG